MSELSFWHRISDMMEKTMSFLEAGKGRGMEYMRRCIIAWLGGRKINECMRYHYYNRYWYW